MMDATVPAAKRLLEDKNVERGLVSINNTAIPLVFRDQGTVYRTTGMHRCSFPAISSTHPYQVESYNMHGESYNAPDCWQFGPSRDYPEANEPGPSRGRSDYHGAPQGTTHPAHGGPAPTPYWPQPGVPVGYVASQAQQQPPGPVGQSPRSGYPVPSAAGNEPYAYPLGFAHQRSRGPTAAGWSPSQGSAGVQNSSGGPSPQVGRQPLAEANRTDRMMVASPPRRPHMVEMPTGPQDFNQRNLPPQMPVPLPFFNTAGRRRALIIGINYTIHPRRDFELKMCIEDAYGIASFLLDTLGYARDDVRVMTDENPWDLPTERNILDAMRQLVRGAQPHDSFLFYFSGHALQVKDLTGYEPSGFAECICAMDYLGNVQHPNANTPGLIADSVMHHLMVKDLPRQCRLTAIFDSCHSGTLLSLPYRYKSNGEAKEISHPERLRYLRQRMCYADVVSLSASKDHQAAFETRRGGALRWAFIESVRAYGNTLTYRELLSSVREFMDTHRFPQRPQLSSSYEIDTNTRFTA